MKKQKFPKPEIDSWIASKNNGATDEDSLLLINNRDKLEIIYEGGDSQSYEYDLQAIVRLKNKYFYLTTSGCSCSEGQDTTWIIEWQNSTLKELIAWLEKGGRREKEALKELIKIGLVKDKSINKTDKIKVNISGVISIDKNIFDKIDSNKKIKELVINKKFVSCLDLEYEDGEDE